MAENGVGGRSMLEMMSGAEAVRKPSFTVQRTSKYQRNTVLDNLYPSGNGMSEMDRQRVMLGVPRSNVGTADSTFEKQLWLRNSQSAARDAQSGF